MLTSHSLLKEISGPHFYYTEKESLKRWYVSTPWALTFFTTKFSYTFLNMFTFFISFDFQTTPPSSQGRCIMGRIRLMMLINSQCKLRQLISCLKKALIHMLLLLFSHTSKTLYYVSIYTVMLLKKLMAIKVIFMPYVFICSFTHSVNIYWLSAMSKVLQISKMSMCLWRDNAKTTFRPPSSLFAESDKTEQSLALILKSTTQTFSPSS